MLPWVDLDIMEIAFFYTSAMADPVTIQDIYDLFRASQVEWDRRAAEADRRAAEAKAEADRRAAEADRRAAEAKAEADRRAAETDRRAAEAKAEADRRAAEADRRAAKAKAEADRRFAELERIAANTSREVAGLTTRWGQFVENLVEPAVIRLFQERGIDVQETSRRMKSKRSGGANGNRYFRCGW
jgi:multidrug resistance efflux pump